MGEPLLLLLAGQADGSLDAGETPFEVEAILAPVDAAPMRHPAVSLLESARIGLEGRLQASLPDGRLATLTLDPDLQRKMSRLLQAYRVPQGAVVAVEPATGRILAMAEHARAGGDEAVGLSLRPIAPAASVFKVVTAAALLERGLPPESRVCYHGGKRRIRPAHLQESPRDHRCVDLGEALGHSANVPFARLAQRHLEPLGLRDVAERFLFDRPIRLEGVEIHRSPLDIPEEPFEFATTAAGFNVGVRLTPLHGALIAAAVANGGAMPMPRLIDAIDGEPVDGGESRQVIAAEIAAALASMMEHTVQQGTARAAFRERRVGYVMGDVRVAGKTGSLFERDPFRDATWFVGFAPVEQPAIAVAAVIVNEEIWHVRAPWIAREAMRAYLFGTTPFRQ